MRGHLAVEDGLGHGVEGIGGEVLGVALLEPRLADGDLGDVVVVEHPVVVPLRELGLEVVLPLAPIHERLVLERGRDAVAEVGDEWALVRGTHLPHEVAARLPGQRRDAHARGQNHAADDFTRHAEAR